MTRFLLGAVAGGVIYAALPPSMRAEISDWVAQAAILLANQLANIAAHITTGNIA